MLSEKYLSEKFGPIQLAAFLSAFIGSLVPVWMSLPLLSILLKNRGYDEDIIGIVSAMPWVGLTLAAPLLPDFVRRIGLQRSLAFGTLLGTAALLSFFITDSLALWSLINFIQGIALGIRWVAADTWVNAAVPESRRGRINGIYDMLTGGAVGFGPTLLIWSGTSDTSPLLLGAGIAAASLLPLIVVWKSAPDLVEEPSESHVPTWRVPLVEPDAFFALILAGLAEATSLALLPLYGLSHGLSDASATLLISVTQVGVLVGSMGFGLLADWLNRTGLLLGAVAVTALAPIAIPAVIASFGRWPVLLVWGIGQGGSFVVAMIILGTRFAPAGLPQAMTVAMVGYTIGGLMGPSAAGWAVSRFGADALPLTLATCGILVLAPACLKLMTRTKADKNDATRPSSS